MPTGPPGPAAAGFRASGRVTVLLSGPTLVSVHESFSVKSICFCSQKSSLLHPREGNPSSTPQLRRVSERPLPHKAVGVGGPRSGPGSRTHLLRVMFSRERWVVTLLDLLAEGEEVHFIAIEGALESGHLQGKGEGREECSASGPGGRGTTHSGPHHDHKGQACGQQDLPGTPRSWGSQMGPSNLTPCYVSKSAGARVLVTKL